jgi:hypothetical protein
LPTLFVKVEMQETETVDLVRLTDLINRSSHIRPDDNTP